VPTRSPPRSLSPGTSEPSPGDGAVAGTGPTGRLPGAGPRPLRWRRGRAPRRTRHRPPAAADSP